MVVVDSGQKNDLGKEIVFLSLLNQIEQAPYWKKAYNLQFVKMGL